MSPVPRGRSASEYAEQRAEHRRAWLAALGLGGIIIVAGNLIGFGAWWVALIVAFVMFIYIIVIKDIEVPDDSKGDSIYYLGLLFTFAALVAALVSFGRGSDTGDFSAAGSIINFGIALLTTIVGLAGRVWFTMSKESPGDLEDAARFQLDEAVSRMKLSLDRARDDLDIMSSQFQVSSAHLGEMAESIGAGSKQAVATLSGLHQQNADISSAIRELTDELGELKTVCYSSLQAFRKLETQAEVLGRWFDEVRVRLAPLEEAFQKFGGVAGPAAERLSFSLRQVKSTGDAVYALGETFAEVRRSAEGANRVFSRLSDSVDQNGFLPLWKESVELVREGALEIRGTGESAAAMNAEFRELTKTMALAKEELGAVLGSARSVNEQMSGVETEVLSGVSPVRSMTHDLYSDLAAACRQTSDFSKALGEATLQAQGLFDTLREGRRIGPTRRWATQIRHYLEGTRATVRNLLWSRRRK